MPRIELEEAPKRPAAQSMADEALLTLKEGQFVSHIELIRVAVVFRTPAIVQFRECVRDVVVRRSEGPDAGAACEQLGIYIQQL